MIAKDSALRLKYRSRLKLSNFMLKIHINNSYRISNVKTWEDS